MSWTQTVTLPSPLDLLVQLTGKDIGVLLEEAFNAQGVKIEKIENIELDGESSGVTLAQRVTLSDGRVFEPKLVKQETADGNWGNDIYEYRLRWDEKVEVEHVDLSQPHENGEENSGSECDSCCDEGC